MLAPMLAPAARSVKLALGLLSRHGALCGWSDLDCDISSVCEFVWVCGVCASWLCQPFWLLLNNQSPLVCGGAQAAAVVAVWYCVICQHNLGTPGSDQADLVTHCLICSKSWLPAVACLAEPFCLGWCFSACGTVSEHRYQLLHYAIIAKRFCIAESATNGHDSYIYDATNSKLARKPQGLSSRP